MKWAHLTLIVVVIVATVMSVLAFTLALQSIAPDPIPLDPAEVREYQGADLSAISEFRENSISGPQYINESEYRLTVTGLTDKTMTYSYAEVLAKYPHYSKVVTLNCVEGWDVTILWEGILVRDLLNDAGVDPRATTVIFTAHDGYTTSLPLEYLMTRDILMAYPDEQRHASRRTGLSISAGRRRQMGLQMGEMD
jgi:DMSO/TMAO reductase YedYZ molybdopterin-dependent catalytic subunit